MADDLQNNGRHPARRDALEVPGDSPGKAMRCRACGDVIGYYEPLVLLESTGTRDTSVAAEPEIRVASGQRFHRGCYTSAPAELPPP
jgi:hypothetical protein